jgi:quercetin dioxygenase-like cupin family protein
MSRRIVLGTVAALTLVCGRGDGGPHGSKGAPAGLAVFAPGDIKWADAPAILPRGAKVAVLEGNPSKAGPFVMRVRMPDGYRIAPHTHPKAERVTVLSGTFHLGMGGKFDPAKGRAMPAGSFGTWPAGMKHYVWVEGETVIQLHGTGPWSLTYVNPADDPRGKGGLKSGPQQGAALPGPFSPLNVTNAALPGRAGTRSDYTEQHGLDPVVLVFARDLSSPLVTLVKRLDAEVAKNRSARLRAVVVVLSEDEGLEEELTKLGRQEGIRNVSLALVEPPRLKHYKLAPAADVTVVLYRKRRVAANHAFKKGQLNEEAIAAVLRDIPRVISQQ